MCGQRVKEGVAVELVVAFNADLQRAVAHRPGNTEDYVAVVDLAIVQRDLRPLIDFAADHFGGTAYAAAILASIRQIDALLAQALQERLAVIDFKGPTALIGKSDGEVRHTQMSLVQ